MIIKNKNGEFMVNAGQYNYLMYTFKFTEIDAEIVTKTNFVNSISSYEEADKIFKSDDKYKSKFKFNKPTTKADFITSISDILLVKTSAYEDKANADMETEGVQHNLNIGRYDGLMQAISELNKHLP